MDEREDFLEWFHTTWWEGEVALLNGDATPRFTTWSEQPPVTLFGAWASAHGPAEVRRVFLDLADALSSTTSAELQLVAAEVGGGLAYTVHREIISTLVRGAPRSYSLRVTQVYRREDGEWKVVHRHGDETAESRDIR